METNFLECRDKLLGRSSSGQAGVCTFELGVFDEQKSSIVTSLKRRDQPAISIDLGKHLSTS